MIVARASWSDQDIVNLLKYVHDNQNEGKNTFKWNQEIIDRYLLGKTVVQCKNYYTKIKSLYVLDDTHSFLIKLVTKVQQETIDVIGSKRNLKQLLSVDAENLEASKISCQDSIPISNKWVSQEDIRLLSYINTHLRDGAIDWSEIKNHLPNRSQKSCYNRFYEKLAPLIIQLDMLKKTQILDVFYRSFDINYNPLGFYYVNQYVAGLPDSVRQKALRDKKIDTLIKLYHVSQQTFTKRPYEPFALNFNTVDLLTIFSPFDKIEPSEMPQSVKRMKAEVESILPPYKFLELISMKPV